MGGESEWATKGNNDRVRRTAEEEAEETDDQWKKRIVLEWHVGHWRLLVQASAKRCRTEGWTLRRFRKSWKEMEVWEDEFQRWDPRRMEERSEMRKRMRVKVEGKRRMGGWNDELQNVENILK